MQFIIAFVPQLRTISINSDFLILQPRCIRNGVVFGFSCNFAGDIKKYVILSVSEESQENCN